MHDDYLRAQRLRRGSARPDASPLISERLRALVTGRSGTRIIEASAKRTITQMAGVEARKQFPRE